MGKIYRVVIKVYLFFIDGRVKLGEIEGEVTVENNEQKMIVLYILFYIYRTLKC